MILMNLNFFNLILKLNDFIFFYKLLIENIKKIFFNIVSFLI
jgi:hypothetical protein